MDRWRGKLEHEEGMAAPVVTHVNSREVTKL